MNDERVTVRGVLTRPVFTKKTREGKLYSVLTIQTEGGDEKRVQTIAKIEPGFEDEFFTRGRSLRVTGFARENQWLGEDGKKRVKSYILATQVEVISEYGQRK